MRSDVVVKSYECVAGGAVLTKAELTHAEVIEKQSAKMLVDELLKNLGADR